jgi:hypothetical protein
MVSTTAKPSSTSILAALSKLIVQPEQTFQGLSYGDWAARWCNWLFSEEPDRTEVNDDVVFLRGNMEYYRYAAMAPDTSKDRDDSIDPAELLFYDRTGDKGILISDKTPVFIPVLTATYFIGGGSESGVMYSEEQVRHKCRKENDLSGGIWLTLESNSVDQSNNSILKSTKRSGLLGTPSNPDQNLSNYRTSSRLFKLFVAEGNPFLKDMAVEYPINPGEYDAITDGFFVLLKHLNAGSYRIRFGGKGRGNYRTDAIYDIYVSPEYRHLSTVFDISDDPEGDAQQRKSAAWLGRIPKRDTVRKFTPF